MRHLSSAIALCLAFAGSALAAPLGSGFTYQGQLTDSGAPANGNYDVQFALFTSASGGTAVDTVTSSSLAVAGGLINANLDFTEAPYNGQALWVEVSVRPAGGGSFTTLSPRQTLSATPYALYALNAPAGSALTLPFEGSAAVTQTAFSVTNTGTGGGIGVQGAGTGFGGATLTTSNASNGGVALYAYGNTSAAGIGQPITTALITNDSPSGGDIVEGWNLGIIKFAVDTAGDVSALGTVSGNGNGTNGVVGLNTGGGSGVYGGNTDGGGYGVAGRAGEGSGLGAPTNTGVLGDAAVGIGVLGLSGTGIGVSAVSAGSGLSGPALNVVATQGNGIAILANATTTDAVAVVANGNTSGSIYRGLGFNGATEFDVHANGEVYAHGAFHGNGVDYADRLPASPGLEPGDVVAIGDDGLLHRSASRNASDVAGVYSTRPGVVGEREEESRATIPIALAGVIPVKATTENGSIRPGDLLVSSSTPGRAMRAPANPGAGTVIGKAMQALDHASGRVEMLVMLR